MDEGTGTAPDAAGGKPARPQRAPRLGPGWLTRAWKAAQRDLARVDPGAGDLERELSSELAAEADPVARARKVAEAAAPGDMILLTALTHGVAPAALEAYRGSLRLVSDLAQRRLSIVGLRAGEVVEHDASDRFRAFLERWHDGAGPRALEVDGS